MTGKIDGPRLQPANPNRATPSRKAGSGAKSGRDSVATSDRVDLTDSARGLHEAERALARTPDINTGRVEAIRQALAGGSYKVDSARIADGLLRADRALGKFQP